MYSRNYYPEAAREMNVPGNYDGIAFTDKSQGQSDDQIVSFSDTESSDEYTSAESVRSHNFIDGPLKIPFLSGLFDGGLLSGLNLKIPSLGSEEVLILATAAFLFFSKGGDKECALILLFLLLIN